MRLTASLLILALCNYASIVAPKTDTLRVSATPSNGTISVNGSARGAAPGTVEIPRKGNSAVQVSAPGFAPATCDTSMSPGDGYIASDIAWCVLLFPLGCIAFIDAGGAWNTLNAPLCEVALQPAK